MQKNNNIKVDELEDIVIKEDKKQEVKKPNVIDIMDEDNDNDQTPNNNKKPDIEATRHDISVFKQ